MALNSPGSPSSKIWRIHWYISHIHTRPVKRGRTSGTTALSGDSFPKVNESTVLQRKRSAMSWSGVTVFRERFLITAPRTKYLKLNWIGSIKEIHVSHSWTTVSIICHKTFCCQCSTCYCNLLLKIFLSAPAQISNFRSRKHP